MDGATCGRGLMDAPTNLVPCWFIGAGDAGAAYHFMHDLNARLAHRVQITTDGHRAFLSAVEDAFGADVDYAMLVKLYGDAPHNFARIHQSLRVTPAMEAGVADHVWSLDEIIALPKSN